MAPNFSQRSLQVCRDFLQTAVIIDDRFHFQNPNPPVLLSVTPGRNKASKSITQHKPSALYDGALDAPQLIKSFAVHGIICGALRFQEFQDDSVTFLNIARRADIAIIDWEMEEEKTGRHALTLISNLLKDDLSTPQRFRLISIYTGAEDLSSISEAIQTHIQETFSVQLCSQNQGLYLQYHSIIITIFAKDERGIPDHFKDSVANEQELPERIIKCFANSIHGILPNTALAALTALRGNAHKLLGQFSNRLDAAYLSHKIMSNPPDDAENQLVNLLVSNIAGILEEHEIASQASYPAIESWVTEQFDNRVQYRERIHIKKDNKHAKEQLLKLLNQGLAKASLNKGNKSFYAQINKLKNESTKKVLSELTAVFASSPADAEILDRDLAYMLSCKTSYTPAGPKLEPGSILKECTTNSYLICIQPACDCCRIPAKGRNFLFLPLIPNESTFDISIPQKESHALNLRIDNKAYSVRTLHFKPIKATEPIRARKQGDSWIFVDSSGVPIVLEWIVTLKREISLKLAHDFGKNISRVGITESEWQRRWAK